jgi:hypothetical protein
MMTMRFSLPAILLAACVAGGAGNSRAQSTEPVAGRILSVHCEAHLRKKMTQGDATLSAPRDIALGLSAGDRVECVGAGYLDVLVFDGTKRVTASPKNGFTIPPLPTAPSNPKADNEIALALTSYGVSGATRGIAADSRILWPSENSAVVPEHFVIRWAPVAQKIVLSILSESKDVTVWGPTEVDGGASSLKADAMNSALLAYKAKSASPGLVLTVALANSGDWEEVHFSMLNGRQEQELNEQLDFWEKHTDGLALRLGRGYCFTRHKLFAEAAEEYDSALSIAPESRYLLEDAIRANRFAGRRDRVKELEARLASQPEAANR